MEKNQIQVWQNNVLEMTPIKFVNQTLEQKLIRQYQNNDELLNKSITVFILELEAHFSPNNKTDNFILKDIKNMILSICKNMSIEELFFASKLVRYGEIENVESYGRLTTQFVTKIIVGYKRWKRDLRLTYDLPISKRQEKQEFTDTEKQEILLKGYHRIFDEFKENPKLETLNGCAWLYDYLVKDLKEFCPTDDQIKLAKTKASQIGSKSFKSQSRKKGISEMKIKNDLEQMKKSGMSFIGITKTILLADYFERRLMF